MTIVNYDPKTKERFTTLAHATFVCTTFIRLCGLFYVIVGALMIDRNGVLHRAAFPLLNQFVIGGMPLGNLSSGVVYALLSLFPLHTIFGILGFVGVILQNKVIIIIHTCFLLFGIIVDILCIVLLSMLLYGINSWIKTRFPDYYQDYKYARLNDEVKTAFGELFGAMNCNDTVTGVGCWDKYYPVMDGNIQLFLSLLSLSIILEITNVVLSDIVYRRLDSRSSSGMFGQCPLFVQRSWTTRRMKFVFAVIQAGDMIFSTVLLIGGVVISQSRFITDGLVRPVFENLRFDNYYLPGLVTGLTATMILIGCLNLLSCGLGFNMLCFKSGTKSKVHVTYQIVMVVITLIALIFWSDLLTNVGDMMSDELSKEFLVYGDSTYTGLHYSRAWNAIFLTYSCCGVRGNDSFNGTLFGESRTSYVVPYQCGTGATLANSKTDFNSTRVITTPTYYTTVCDTPLVDEIETYAVLFGVTCGGLLIIKICNIVMIHKNAVGMEVAVQYHLSLWKTVKDNFRTNPMLLFGSIAFVGIGLVCFAPVALPYLSSYWRLIGQKIRKTYCFAPYHHMLALGILITGLLLRFNDILGHKDIQHLLKHIYISGLDVTYWVTTMSDVMISSGTVSLIIFCVGNLSVAAKVTPMYYVTTVLLILSVLFKFICIMVWIPIRMSFDNDMGDAMYDVLQANYRTDKPHTESYIEDKNLGFNTLFYQGKCCLTGRSPYSINMIQADAPWTCRDCARDTGVRWPLETTNCTTVLDDTIHRYDTTAVVLSVCMILLEVMLIIVLDRIYKTRVSPGQSRGLVSNTCFNNRYINKDKMPNFTLLTVVYVSGIMVLSVIQLSAWIAILVYVIRGDTQLDQLSVGTLNLGEMTHGASITVLVVIPISIIMNGFKLRWCLSKWNTGLRWSLLPESGLLITDVVIFCLCAQQLESIRLSNQNIYPVMYVLNLAYLCVSMSMQVMLILIKDRLHKHIDISLATPNPSGMFSTLWQGILTHRYFTVSEKTNTKLIGFCFLSGFLMVWEIATWVAVWLQGVAPGYMKGEFLDELYDVHSSGRYTVFYSYGYLLRGLVVTALVIQLIYVIIHVITMAVAIRQHRIILYVASGMLVLVLLVDIIMTGLAGVLLDTAYNCYNLTTNTTTSQTFCSGPVSKLYDLSGVFIGLTVWHAVLVVVLIWLCVCLANKVIDASSVVPLEDETRITKAVEDSHSDSPTRIRLSSLDSHNDSPTRIRLSSLDRRFPASSITSVIEVI